MRLDPSLESEKADGRIELGDVLVRAGQMAEGIAELTRALDLEPDRLGISLRRGDAYRAEGDLESAEADYAQALERDHQCAEALAGRSLVRLAQGRNEEARADALAAIAIEPSLGSTLPELATAFSALAAS